MITELKKFYAKKGRHDLPWRQTTDPYKILVSEVMLQQTQVERVVPYYTRWIKKYPTARKLAAAKLIEVLKDWQGLGYNRRAKYLHDASAILAKEGWTGQALPGVGPYTRGAVEAFAFNKPGLFIETNIRSVFLYFFFPDTGVLVADTDILPHIGRELKKSRMEPREFYWALMDYGAHLKKSGIRLNRRSAQYAKQTRFEGSARQARAARLRALLARGASEKMLVRALQEK